MKDIKNIVQLIGNTPLIRVDLGIPHSVLVKVESYNLTGSIKDRMAYIMMKEAIKKGIVTQNTTIIEATTGNTGIALSALAAIHGYNVIIVMPENVSRERVQMMKLYGAEVILTDKRYGPMGAIRKRDELAKRIENSWIPDQFTNTDNITAHIAGVAREIVNQTDKNIDYLVHGVGTGGTLMGISRVLTQKYPDMKVIAVEPEESAVLRGGKPGDHGIQGIGEGFIPSIIDRAYIDDTISVSTEEALMETSRFPRQHGILIGISSGANIAAIKKLSKRTKGNKIFLTIFADRGERYLSVLGDI